MTKVIANLGNYVWFKEQMFKHKNLYVKLTNDVAEAPLIERIKKPRSPVFKKKVY